MKRLFLILLLALPFAAYAEAPGKEGFESLKRCIMQNDSAYCHSVLTLASHPLFDRFYSYKLMPCLPTDAAYQSEKEEGPFSVVKATLPASDTKLYVMKLIFVKTPEGERFDLMETLRRGLGPHWRDKVDLSEQLYLMMKQNLGDKLTCDQLNAVVVEQ